MNYRPEIDGLRTLAILPVIIYHLKIPMGDGYFLPGGFLGVDVFFVISGFLITKILLGDLHRSGRFNIWTFYIRRARRILPALFLVTFAAMVASSFILLPTEADRFAASTLASLGFVSNFFWYVELGEYGARSGLLQPMLHTWSLAIEEQFYLLFPWLLVLIRPKHHPRRTLWILCAVALGSLALAQATTFWNKDFSFFSPASRAWELLVGSVLAAMAVYAPGALRPGPALRRIVPKLAVIVLFVCFWAIDLNAVAHPGLITLPCVLATAGLIWCTHPGEAVTRTLSTAPFVFVGKLSYSLYLWHFPIFAFGRLVILEHLDGADRAILVGLTLLCAVLGYYLVERPFRYGLSPRAALVGLVSSVVITAAFFVTASQTDILNRHQAAQLAAIYGANAFDNRALRDASWRPLVEEARRVYEGEDGRPGPHAPSASELEALWFDDPDARNVLIVGNSHSKDLFNALHTNPALFPGLDFARLAMGNRFHDDARALLYASPNFEASDVVMIAPRYVQGAFDNLERFIRELSERGKTVVLVGNTAEFDPPGIVPIFDLLVRLGRVPHDLQDVNLFAFDYQAPRVHRFNERLRSIAEATGVLFLSRTDLMCAQAQSACTLVTPDGRKAMYDNTHWTLEGAAYFGQVAAQINWLGPIQGD